VRAVAVWALLALACAACSASGHPSAASTAGPSTAIAVGTTIYPVAERSPAPSLRGTTITGAAFELARELGHGPVAVNVWASWCDPCRQEMPVLARAAGSSLRVVGIDEQDNRRTARTFARSRGARYPSLSDPDGTLLARFTMLPQDGVPSTIFLDRQGRVAARVVGPLDRAVLSRILRQLGATS